MNERSFFAELKRRNVYKVAVAYAVVAWLVIQAASIILPTYEAPAWTMKVLIAALAIGFPIAAALAWVFEITPEGIKRAEDISPNESIKRRRGRKLIAVTIVLACVAAALLAWQLFRGGTRAVASPAGDKSTDVAARVPPEQSIAVLPFENLSEDKANAFFASGIQDEILTRLAKISSLKVISRTSTQQYQSKPASVGEIAKQLGVAHILEGSVQKSGNAVHINVQLIKAATDTHVWAESYNRKLDDIFAVQAELAAAIAEQLNAKLSGSEKKELAQKPTENAAAYEAYLRGLTQFFIVSDVSRYAAVQSFEEAVRLDPNFALGWATLSRAHSVTYLQNIDRSASRKAAAEQTLAEALRLQPQLPETQLARAWYDYCIRRDYTGARQMLQELRMIWPGNAEIVQVIGYISARMGEYQKATEYLDAAIVLNPRDPYLRAQTVQTRIATRDLAAALRVVDEALKIWPDDRILLNCKVMAHHGLGDLTRAQVTIDRIKAKADENETPRLSKIVNYQWKLRRTVPPADTLQYYERLAAKQETKGWKAVVLWSWADLLAYSRDEARAKEIFTKLRDLAQALLREQPDNGEMAASHAYALAGLGERDAALGELDRAIALTANDARVHGGVQELKARLLARFGDKENAIELLQRLLAMSYDGYYTSPLTAALLRLDPDFDSLRGDARFEKLCQDK